jgi:HD-GYP domain-containing protein (c-di-GMP phosphodiesterase class II)
VFKLDIQTSRLVSLHVDSGVDGGLERPLSLNMKLGIAGMVAVTGETLRLDDVWLDPRFDRSVDQRTGYRTRSMICVPLKSTSGETVGVVQAINKHADKDGGVFTAEDAKDSLNADHSERVTTLTAQLGQRLGLSAEDIEVLRVATILHDYGMIGVPDSIVMKPGALDADEMEKVRAHPGLTEQLLNHIRFSRRYRKVPMIAAAHHEVMDGSGYPRGLKGSEIPFLTRILTVADVYVALTSARPWRPGMSQSDALAFMQAGSGKQFDPAVVARLSELELLVAPD